MRTSYVNLKRYAYVWLPLCSKRSMRRRDWRLAMVVIDCERDVAAITAVGDGDRQHWRRPVFDDD